MSHKWLPLETDGQRKGKSKTYQKQKQNRESNSTCHKNKTKLI